MVKRNGRNKSLIVHLKNAWKEDEEPRTNCIRKISKQTKEWLKSKLRVKWIGNGNMKFKLFKMTTINNRQRFCLLAI